MRKKNSALLQVRITPGDLFRLKCEAEKYDQSVAEYVREMLGVDDPPHGGARKGAGRPKKRTAKPA